MSLPLLWVYVPSLQTMPLVLVSIALVLVLAGCVWAHAVHRNAVRRLRQAEFLRVQARADFAKRAVMPRTFTLIRDGRCYELTWVRAVVALPREAGEPRPEDSVAMNPALPPGVELTVIPHDDVRRLFEVTP